MLIYFNTILLYNFIIYFCFKFLSIYLFIYLTIAFFYNSWIYFISTEIGLAVGNTFHNRYIY